VFGWLVLLKKIFVDREIRSRYFSLNLRKRLPEISSESTLVKNAAVRWHGVM
jgi:hypothetical protein